MSRTCTFNNQLGERILLLLEMGHSVRTTCEASGVRPRTLRSWLQKAREQPEEYPELANFLPRYTQAIGTGIKELEERVLKDARLSGELSLKVLERRRGRDWGQQNWRIRQMERELAESRKELAELKELILGKKNED